MVYIPGAPRRVNDKYRKGPVVRSMSELAGLPTASDMAALKRESRKHTGEVARADFVDVKAMLVVLKAMKVLRKRKDKRRRPSRVSKKAFALSRKLRLK